MKPFGPCRVPALSIFTCAALATAAHAQDALHLGAIIPLSGPYASYGETMATTLGVALDHVNAAGGVLGQPLSLTIEDDQGDPTAGLNAARKLIDVDGASGIVATFASAITLPVLAYTVPAGVPLLTVSGAPAISDIGLESGLAYRLVPTEATLGEGYAWLAHEEGFERAHVLVANSAAQLNAADAFEEEFAAEGGTVTGRTVFEPGQASYQAELNDVLDADPQIIMLGAYTPEAITIARMLYQLDPDVRLVGPLYALNGSFVEAAGPEVVEGTLAVDMAPDASSPTYHKIVEDLTAAAGEAPTINPYMIMDYDMVVVMSLAAEAAGSTDAATLAPFIRSVANAPGQEVFSYEEGLAALRAGNEINYQGASGPIEFLDSGDQASGSMQGFRMSDGAITVIGPVTP